MFEQYQKYGATTVRLGLAAVFLWFGLTQFFNPQALMGYAPSFAFSLPISIKQFMMLNGLFDTLVGALLAIGFFTRFIAFVGALHLAGIAASLGYNDVAVRDWGLCAAALSIALTGPDAWTLDKKLDRKTQVLPGKKKR